MEINKDLLYRAEYATFEEYCDKKWNISAGRARQLIRAARLADRLLAESKNGTNGTALALPQNERQARAVV